MKKLLFIALIALSPCAGAQVIMPTQTFDTDVLLHGTTGSNTAWFAPSSNTPISWVSSGGNPGGYIGYSSSWNNYWGNFVRLPQANCSAWDTVVLSFDMSHSYFANHPNDWIRFYIWDQGSGSYKNPVSHIKINGVESMVNFGVNGYGFRFNVARTWAHVEVFFNMSVITNLSNVLFYFEPNCYYNDGNLFFVSFDNIQLTGIETDYVGLPAADAAEADLAVFPTLFRNEITLRSSKAANHCDIELLNSLGAVVYGNKIELNAGDNKIELPSLAPGIYYLAVRSEFTDFCKKLIRN
jgi:hypothetical protein